MATIAELPWQRACGQQCSVESRVRVPIPLVVDLMRVTSVKAKSSLNCVGLEGRGPTQVLIPSFDHD
ncbi:hypothetical protein TNCV_4149601 [Trichonephila clavipes]|uniref:Uncharacterized protein n=1 Tax=Trichonephila clavipes TaxID=2585209 RepID=A0A8X6W5W0_TRICX|nr:hypothetical protein TNCV_4149601 [Trichonephila clavipes]